MISEFEAINAEVSPREKLLWSGRPQQGFVWNTEDAFLVPFGIVWTAGVLDIGIEGIWSGKFDLTNTLVQVSSIVPLFFLMVGLYLMIGRFVVDAWHRSRTFFGLTDRRAIIVVGGTTYSVPIHSKMEVTKIKHWNKRGTIVFGDGGSDNAKHEKTKYSIGADKSCCFEKIDEADAVYDHVRRLAGL